MKTKIILCIALVILIALGSLNNLVARKAPSLTKEPIRLGHSWQDDAAKVKPRLKSYQSVERLLICISFSKNPFVIYINVIQAPDLGCQNPKEFPYKKVKNDGANKTFRRY